VLFLTLLVRPVVGSHARLDNQLISLASVACQRFAHRAEVNEPDTGGYFARGTAFGLARVVVTDEAESRVTHIVLRDEFRIAGQIAHCRQSKTIHGACSWDR